MLSGLSRRRTSAQLQTRLLWQGLCHSDLILSDPSLVLEVLHVAASSLIHPRLNARDVFFRFVQTFIFLMFLCLEKKASTSTSTSATALETLGCPVPQSLHNEPLIFRWHWSFQKLYKVRVCLAAEISLGQDSQMGNFKQHVADCRGGLGLTLDGPEVLWKSCCSR